VPGDRCHGVLIQEVRSGYVADRLSREADLLTLCGSSR
jgi:hypothetical protein